MSVSVRSKLKGKKVILASQSPRRSELLRIICEDFEVIPAKGEEVIPHDAATQYVAEALAMQKCRDVSAVVQADLVIGCDTVVINDDKILGKPKSPQDAARMLCSLSGKTHRVVSGVAFYCGGKFHSFSQETLVTFRELSAVEVGDYIATGEPSDKAGAYGIQGVGSLLVKGIEGDYFNVVGLPVSALAMLLDKYF